MRLSKQLRQAIWVGILSVTFLLFQNCQQKPVDFRDSESKNESSAAGDGFPFELKTYVSVDQTCQDQVFIGTKVRRDAYDRATVLRENCVDLNPGREIGPEEFQVPVNDPNTMYYNGETLTAEVGATAQPAQFVSGQHSLSSGNSISVARPSGLAAGDLLIGYVSNYQYQATTPPNGWQAASSFNATQIGYGSYLFYKVASAADVAAANFTFSLAGSSFDNFAIVMVYRGKFGATPVIPGGWGDANQASPNSIATYMGGSVAQPGSLLVTIGSTDLGASGEPGAPGGFISRYFATNWATRISDRVQDLPGPTGNFTGTARYRWVTGLFI
ncbi:MAG: hypothetical protein AB7F86_17770, partial [Bdellovibrionales bacterium]